MKWICFIYCLFITWVFCADKVYDLSVSIYHFPHVLLLCSTKSGQVMQNCPIRREANISRSIFLFSCELEGYFTSQHFGPTFYRHQWRTRRANVLKIRNIYLRTRLVHVTQRRSLVKEPSMQISSRWPGTHHGHWPRQAIAPETL